MVEKKGVFQVDMYLFQRTLFVGIFLIFREVIKKCKFVFRERYVRFFFFFFTLKKKSHYVQLAYGVCFEIDCISSGFFQMEKYC